MDNPALALIGSRRCLGHKAEWYHLEDIAGLQLDTLLTGRTYHMNAIVRGLRDICSRADRGRA